MWRLRAKIRTLTVALLSFENGINLAKFLAEANFKLVHFFVVILIEHGSECGFTYSVLASRAVCSF
jgi:hypothetical protein